VNTRHIASFGGDPNRVTISGESSVRLISISLRSSKFTEVLPRAERASYIIWWRTPVGTTRSSVGWYVLSFRHTFYFSDLYTYRSPKASERTQYLQPKYTSPVLPMSLSRLDAHRLLRQKPCRVFGLHLWARLSRPSIIVEPASFCLSLTAL
jgi:hypothetical protein